MHYPVHIYAQQGYVFGYIGSKHWLFGHIGATLNLLQCLCYLLDYIKTIMSLLAIK